VEVVWENRNLWVVESVVSSLDQEARLVLPVMAIFCHHNLSSLYFNSPGQLHPISFTACCPDVHCEGRHGTMDHARGCRMKRDDVLKILAGQRDALRQQFGVKSLALFGSVARDEARETSDVDLLVEFARPVGLFGLFALQNHLEQLLGCSVDLGTPDSLKPRIRSHVLAESIHVS